MKEEIKTETPRKLVKKKGRGVEFILKSMMKESVLILKNLLLKE